MMLCSKQKRQEVKRGKGQVSLKTIPCPLHFASRWQLLIDSLSISSSLANPAWLDLCGRYNENGRFYHNLTHIEQMLDVVDSLSALVRDETAVQLAVWFHDIIYDPRANDNEAQSAAYAANVLHQWQYPQIEKVEWLILATKGDGTPMYDPDFAVLLDADLAVLGASPAKYDRYANAIRQEYAFVPDEAYRNGRSAVLRQFLDRPRIYQTEKMFAERETAVSPNLIRELNSLKNNP